MAKKIIIGIVFSLVLTVVFWNITGRIRLGRTMDNLAFAASPVLAIIIALLLVRSRFMESNRTGTDP